LSSQQPGTRLDWSEIRNRATRFARDWSEDISERAEAQTFWNEFFEIFGLQRRRIAVYEKQVDKLGSNAKGRIDLFWPGTLLAEHKSAGKDLSAAFTQALDYFSGLSEDELPRYVVVSDFRNFRLYDLDEHTETEFPLSELPKRISLFGFIAGYRKPKVRDEDPINIKAVQRLGEIHDALKKDGYGLDAQGHAGHPLQVFLVRLLFCLFADDTGLFSPKDSFLDFLERTRADGSDTGSLLAEMFQALNTHREQRQKSQADQFAAFPHVNGRLFEEPLQIPRFTAEMRSLLIGCCRLDWAAISPAIFGAMFQKIIELDAKDRRRQLGAHYTSEANILKLIGPLFLDELHAEFEHVKHHKNQLFEFHKKLARLNFLDPACGCGNFLVITYRELRKLELDVLCAARAFGQATQSVFNALQVSVDQFHGIELEEFPAQVAQVAMWLTEHQMNVEAGREFGEYFAHLPLDKSANIRHGNALRLDWEAFVPPSKLNYILGNPPFIGKQYQTDEQKEDLAIATNHLKGIGVLDYVCGWYFKAAQYLSGGKEGFASGGKKQFADVRFGETHNDTLTEPHSRHSRESGNPEETVHASKRLDSRFRGNDGLKQTLAIDDLFVTFERQDSAAREKIRCAFVSTNSISQGEQVGVLWSQLFRHGIKIHFAHRTFKWSNEAPGKAAVHCVIVGFGREDVTNKRLFDYAEVDGPAVERKVANINPYLVDAPDVLLTSRRSPMCDAPEIVFGSMPNDGGHLLLTDEEKDFLLTAEPNAAPWVRPFLGAEEFLNGIIRWCLWLVDLEPQNIQQLPEIRRRVDAVRLYRLSSKRETTRGLADFPTKFGEIRYTETPSVVIPSISSERRHYIPIGLLDSKTIASNKLHFIPNATTFHFGIIQSHMHMAWMRYVAGRMKSDYQYSNQIVYNNFPWPEKLEDKHRIAIETAAQAVLDARAAHPDATLAQLYDPLSMPPDLVKAHQILDRAVDAAYVPDGGTKSYASDADRVAFLFRRYAALSGLLS